MWILAGFRVQEIEGCAAPTYTPVDKQSEIVLNECDSLYRWRDGGWHLLNPSSTYWTVSDGTNSELITNQTVTFTGSGGAVVSYNPTTNTVTIDAGSSSGGDNWGSQVAITDASLTGDGTAGNALSINGYSAASNGTFPSKSAGGITWQTVDLSATNELQTLANTSNATTHTATLSNSGGSLQLAEGSGITLTTTGTTLDGIVTIAAVDASTTNESLTISDGTDSENLGGQTLNVTATGIASVDYIPGTNTLSIGAVEVDGSVSNELQTYAHSGTTSYTNTLSNGGGSFTLQSGGIVSISHSTGTVTISATEVDGSTTNEAWTIDADDVDTEVISNQTVKFQGAGIAVTDYNATTNVLLITATEVDGSVSNELQTFSNTSTATTHTVTLSNSGGSLQLAEGSGVTLTTTGTPLDGVVTIAAVDASTTNEIQTYGHSGTTSYTNTLSLGGGSFTLQSGGIVSISNSSGTVTISATEVDGSTTNELQTLSNTSDATSHTVTLSNSGGSVQLIEGSGITLATGGTGLNGTVTITATDASATNEAWTIDGDDADTEVISNQTVKFQGAGITTTDYNPATDVLLITSTEVDGSITNELQTYAHSGTTSYTNTLSNSGGSFTLQSGGIVSISHSSGTVTISATEVDGSVSNELQTYSHSGTTSYTNTLSNGGGSFILQAAGTVSISHSAGTVTITGAAEVDGSITNEGILGVAAGTGTTSIITSNTSGANGVTLQAGGIVSLTESTSSNGGTITITATEVDGSTTNEVLTISDGTDSEALGGQTLTVAATGIATVDYVPATNTLTIGAVEVDGSVSNELQTYSHSGTTSYTNTLSNGGGSFTLQSGGIISISHSAGTTTISATEVDGSTTNELQTLANTSDATTHTTTLSNSGGSTQFVEGSGITLATTGTTLNGILTITAVDASATNEAWTIDADDLDTEVISNQTVKFQGAGIAVTDYNPSTDVLLITATEVDGSISNELQTYSHSGTTSYTNTLSNGGGSFTLQSGGIVTLSHSAGTITISATEVDGSITNEALTISDGTDSEALGGQTLTVAGAGIATADYVPATNTLTITATEVDGNISNEGSLTVAAGSGTTSIINSNTSGQTGVTITAAGILTISESGNVITLTATEVDGSATNEAWTIDGDDADTEVISNQTVKFQGAGITTTDYNSTTDVMLITSTEVDGNVSNEGSLTVAAGASNTSIINSNTSGQTGVTLTAAGILTISESGNVITLTGTEVDGSTTNELQTFANTSNATTHTVTLSNSGGSIQLAEGAGITLATGGTGLNGTVTITATDASATNEAWTIDGDDADTEVISNQTVKFQGAGITTTDYNSTTDVMLITSTEVDGNVSNEGSLTVAAGASNTSIINSNTSGQTGVTLTAAGILTISESGNVITLTGTEVDGSTTNELQTFANTSNATTHTVTLSNSGGSIQLAEGAGITLTTTGTTGDGIVTIAATGGGITGAQNGLYVSGSNVRMGTNPLIEPTIIDHNGFEYRHSDGKISLTNQGTSYTTQGADFGVEGIEAVPTLNSTPTKDGIIELRASNAGSAQPNSLTIGAYTTDADGVWIQARSHSVPNFEYPLSLQPRGGQMSVGRFSGLDALVTFSGTGLAGSGIAGQVLHLENNEGNGKTSMSMGAGTDALDSEVAWFDASDALRITNRSNVTGTSTVRIAVGGETSDKVIVTNAGMGVGSTGTTAILSTLQVEGSLGLQTNSPGSSTTLTAANNVLVFLGSSNATFTLPTASTVDGRVYWIMNHSAASTVTLSQSVTKANGSTFTVINPRQTALIIAVTGNGWRGSLWTSE